MIKETYKQIIFTDNVEKLKEELKNKNNNIFIGDIDNTDDDGYDNLDSILRSKCDFDTGKNDYYISIFTSIINSIHTDRYDYVHIHIKNIDKITSKQSLYCYKLNFFNLLNSITNKQIYFIIDIKYKDYVFNQIEEYNKHINRLRSFGEIHNQVIFVDDIEKVKQNMNTETEMFNELDGNKCKDTESFYDEAQKQFKFPEVFGRNVAAFYDWITDYDWEWTLSITTVFNYIKNIDNILLDDEREKTAIFDTLLNYVIMRTERVFILIDKKDKDYFLEQVKIWNEKYKYKYE